MISIRGRLLLLLLIGLAVVLSAGGAAVYLRARAGLRRQLDAEVEARVRALAPLASVEDDEYHFEFDDWPAGLAGNGWFRFLTEDGELLRESPGLLGAALPVHEPELDAIEFDDLTLPDGRPGRGAWLAARPRIEAGEDEQAPDRLSDEQEMIVVAALERGPVDRALATLLAALLMTGAALAVTVSALVLAGVPWGLRPLRRLGQQLEEVGPRGVSTRFDSAAAPAELRPICRELNSMLDRVERTIARERAFADAAAHELRTPLTELRTAAEVAVRWPDQQRAVAALHQALEIGREMERIVESLLRISRGSANHGAPAGPVALAPLVRDAVQRAAPAIQARRLNVALDLPSRQSLAAPREALEIIVRNLIDNAVQYTPEGGAIAVSGDGADPRGAVLTVENGPVQMSDADVPRLFEPFWRKDASRGDREHVGLGLAVVQRIAGATGFEIQASLAGGRLRMSLRATA